MLTIATLVLASTVLVADDPNSAYTAASPIRITGCSSEPLMGTINAGGLLYEPVSGSKLHISFVSISKEVAEVTFAVNDLGKMTNVVDVGKFSTGVTISHDYDWSYGSDNLDCTVVSLRYADGSAWSRPVEAAAALNTINERGDALGESIRSDNHWIVAAALDGGSSRLSNRFDQLLRVPGRQQAVFAAPDHVHGER